MTEADVLARFSLLGGPLHRLGARLGLVHDHTRTLPLGLALGALLWGVLVCLAYLHGGAGRLFSLELVGVHVRLLAVIPLLFLAESWLDPPAATFVRTIRGSGIVPDDAALAFERAVARTTRLANWPIADLLCLAVAVLVSIDANRLPLSGSTASFDAARADTLQGLAGDGYWLIGLPFFRFLLFRWVWRIALWIWLLVSIARLNLHLRATHPDGVAGLGYLEVVHAHFAPLVFALSAIQAAALAEELAAGAPFSVVYPVIGVLLAFDAALFLGPLFIFAPRIWACRIRGMAEFTAFGERYVEGFEAKWLRPGSPLPQDMLGTADVQSLANLYDSVTIVRNVRMSPITARLFWSLGSAAALPLLPLLLFKYPLSTILQTVVSHLLGL